MDLIQLKHYLQERQMIPLRDIALHFNTDSETIRPLLQLWMAKGKVIRVAAEARKAVCKDCCACDPASIEIYSWRD